MTAKLQMVESKKRLQQALANGEHCRAREAHLELLRASKAWLLERPESESAVAIHSARQLARLDAPCLLGERVEIEHVEFGLRFVWVRGTVTDFRPAAIRARQLRNPRALDYLVREDDGEERWRADEGIRRRTD